MSDMATAAELRNQTAEELDSFIAEKKDELFKLRLAHFTGQLESSAKLGQTRRELARALTVQGEKTPEAQAPQGIRAKRRAMGKAKAAKEKQA